MMNKPALVALSLCLFGCAPETSMHGAAVASIAVGKTVGVAPGADLCFIAETQGTIQRAIGQKIDVISVETAGLGIGRVPGSDPNAYQTLRPGLFWWSDYRKNPTSGFFASAGKSPLDHRCTASPTGVSDYAHYPDGRMRWAVPYVARLYVLGCQVDPTITPARFQDPVWKTSQTVDPVKLIGGLGTKP